VKCRYLDPSRNHPIKKTPLHISLTHLIQFNYSIAYVSDMTE